MYAVKILKNNWYDLLPIKDENMHAGFVWLGVFFVCVCTTELFQMLCIFILEKHYRSVSSSPHPAHGKLYRFSLVL